MTDATIRPFTPEDYPDLVALHTVIYPTFPTTEDEYRAGDVGDGWGGWVDAIDGRVVGMSRPG